MAQDPDEDTRAELSVLLGAATGGDTDALAEITALFSGRLAFGTAGLRGELGPGPLRMNRVLVTQAAAGLGQFLLDTGRTASVVIGYDGRVNSDVFARDSAEVLAGLGIDVTLLPSALPTPVLAFAVRHLDAGAGVMVTASHNPPRDNGYKVYLGQDDDGSQIVPPVDATIAEAIDAIAAGSITDLARSSEYAVAGPSLVQAYVEATAALVDFPEIVPDDQPKVVYTAMHGVGWATARAVFEHAGFRIPDVVPEQIEPDGAFPTVPFPNPEEPGAMDLAIARGIAVGADLVIANDPDADRLALAIPSVGADGARSFRQLSGNEVGWLLGWRAAERATMDGPTSDLDESSLDPGSAVEPGVVGSGDGADAATGLPDGSSTAVLAASIVSSPALRRVAERYGLGYRDTLTGFKWVSRVPGLVFGYEEALGYLVDPEVVRDKDGISAALDLLSLATELAARGRTIADRLDEFAATFGAFASGQVATRVDDLARIDTIMAALRATPPTTLGGVGVLAVTDFLDGVEGFPPNDILRWDLEGDGRVIVRPSGTEPKVKVYLDTVAESSAKAEALVARLADAVRPLVS
ncbi:phospho-sugar mutase [Curtobacterium sp. Leaf261]|uniref:phospho-sugar mutase n=1 Tax=Curtobacterium sp. Leaf261 TaxID=1736311 RepID=UPI000700A023|nr:phospho-sugar mutase [Curtobacterium sp. Leaf261]KQO62448.1 phosphomannomutase [Curtobacterium sp. Leaf261]